MRKILLTGLLASSALFAGDNLVTVLENNSLYKIGKNNIYNIDDKNNANIFESFKNKTFKNHSPYYYNAYTEAYDTSPTIITMIGEKSIQYGSIYSKGFGKKYNINTLGVLVKNNANSLALKTLDTFNKNDLIYARTRLNHYTKDDFVSLENYIDDNLDVDTAKRYYNRLDFIYNILDYTNALYELEESININVIRPTLFDYTKYIKDPEELSATSGQTYSFGIISSKSNGKTTTSPEYTMKDNIITRYCSEPYQVREFSDYSDEGGSTRYVVDYRIKKVMAMDVTKPIPLTSMYMFKYGKCNTVKDAKYTWRRPEIVHPSHPSAKEQKKFVLGEMKRLRNGGDYLTTMKSLFAKIKNEDVVKETLKTLRDKGVNNGKILHVNYGVGEAVDNGNLITGLVKNVSMATLFNTKINFLMNEGFVYDINNPPSYFIDKTDTYSEISLEDKEANKYNSLYYIVNQKIQSNVPEKSNFHAQSNLIPLSSRNDARIKNISAGELIWLTDNQGKYISPYLYKNENEILIDAEDSLSSEQIITGLKNYARSQIDTQENAKEMYPMYFKGMIFKYIPKNSDKKAIKYFGPKYEGKMFLDKYTKKTINEIKTMECPASFSGGTCPEDKKIEKIEEEIITEDFLYCGIKMDNPDTDNYNYYVFEEQFNRIVEEPFGDVQYHKYLPMEKTSTEVFHSNNKIPGIFKFFGNVENETECYQKSKVFLESKLKEDLINNNIYDFDYNSGVDELDTLATTNFGTKSDLMTQKIDEFLLNKYILTRSFEVTPQVKIEGEVDYKDFEGDTILNFFKKLKEIEENQYGYVDNIDTLIIYNEDFSTIKTEDSED